MTLLVVSLLLAFSSCVSSQQMPCPLGGKRNGDLIEQTYIEVDITCIMRYQWSDQYLHYDMDNNHLLDRRDLDDMKSRAVAFISEADQSEYDRFQDEIWMKLLSTNTIDDSMPEGEFIDRMVTKYQENKPAFVAFWTNIFNWQIQATLDFDGDGMISKTETANSDIMFKKERPLNDEDFPQVAMEMAPIWVPHVTEPARKPSDLKIMLSRWNQSFDKADVELNGQLTKADLNAITGRRGSLSYMDKYQIQKWKAFLQTDELDTVLSRQSFLHSLARMYILDPVALVAYWESVNSPISLLDHDGDGEISKRELAGAKPSFIYDETITYAQMPMSIEAIKSIVVKHNTEA